MVRYIADQFLGMGVMRTHRGSMDFEQAFDLVKLLINGVALTSNNASPMLLEESIPEEERWIQVLPGQPLNRTDRVRIRADAYAEESGNLQHNGRQGSVLGVRYGRVVVHYDDDPAGVGSYHDLRLLEKRIG